MLIRQSKNTFIRTTEHYGYVTNQLTRHDRTYDEAGADLLREISREPQEIDDIIHRLLNIYDGVDFQMLKTDFMEFANSLANDKFVVIGDSVEKLNHEDEDFTYEGEEDYFFDDENIDFEDEGVGGDIGTFGGNVFGGGAVG